MAAKKKATTGKKRNLRDLKARGVNDDAKGKRAGNTVRGGASTLPEGTQTPPSQTKVVVHP
jgi:hypothetical protein